jgi:hypothetical protein
VSTGPVEQIRSEAGASHGQISLQAASNWFHSASAKMHMSSCLAPSSAAMAGLEAWIRVHASPSEALVSFAITGRKRPAKIPPEMGSRRSAGASQALNSLSTFSYATESVWIASS